MGSQFGLHLTLKLFFHPHIVWDALKHVLKCDCLVYCKSDIVICNLIWVCMFLKFMHGCGEVENAIALLMTCIRFLSNFFDQVLTHKEKILMSYVSNMVKPKSVTSCIRLLFSCKPSLGQFGLACSQISHFVLRGPSCVMV